MKIENTTVLVTGANGGIGNVLVGALLAAGVGKVYAAARDPATLKAAVAAGNGKVVALGLDITKDAQVTAAAKQCADTQILINNAGVNESVPFLKPADLSIARREMEVNYFGTAAMARAFAPVLAKNGGGAMVNLLTLVSFGSMPAMGSYCASKAATWSLTQSLRAELKAQGTLVIGVMPGATDTRLTKDYRGPKDPPSVVTDALIQGIKDDSHYVWAGGWAQQVRGLLGSGLWEFENQLATYLSF